MNTFYKNVNQFHHSNTYSFTHSFFSGLTNPVDTIYHLQPTMIVALLPLAIAIEGRCGDSGVNTLL